MKSTWNMMSYLKIAINNIQDATKLCYVFCKSILKYFKSKFQKFIYFRKFIIFHCNVTQGFRNQVGLCRDHFNLSKSDFEFRLQDPNGTPKAVAAIFLSKKMSTWLSLVSTPGGTSTLCDLSRKDWNPDWRIHRQHDLLNRLGLVKTIKKKREKRKGSKL